MTDKRTLRAKMRAIREEHSANESSFDSPPEFLHHLREGVVVATYMPVGGEADPTAFNLDVLGALGKLALPFVVDKATPLRFLEWPRNAELVRGPFGLWQTAEDSPQVIPDIILTPLVAFDRTGNRLGQGAGHYDRAFVEYPQAWRVGVAWSVQQVDSLPADPWDVPLHLIITEKDVITP